MLQAGPCRLSFAWPAGHARVKPTVLTLAYVQVKYKEQPLGFISVSFRAPKDRSSLRISLLNFDDLCMHF